MLKLYIIFKIATVYLQQKLKDILCVLEIEQTLPNQHQET